MSLSSPPSSSSSSLEMPPLSGSSSESESAIASFGLGLFEVVDLLLAPKGFDFLGLSESSLDSSTDLANGLLERGFWALSLSSESLWCFDANGFFFFEGVFSSESELSLAFCFAEKGSDFFGADAESPKGSFFGSLSFGVS